ncbi:glycosyltransferase family 9 protein [Ohtaekwangia koreensis]|uniref:ADP-heptose:LPS heptosyltransferase n=1 Tax=Ohtaekwangia koreensis TaxID=688867 RepID=A0A1T5LDW5_9BACT|nr:glycosyltransferase family 9 protein [Ohtaekwangia koreensis]SKC74181.1 ADP-heptose:LPS heptosyltransferase [Ohtaekwangia koreensis]
MRFQALGDTIITLPYLQSLKRQYPDTTLHLFTRKEVDPIPGSIILFDRIISLGGKRNAKVQFLLSLVKMPWLWSTRYDAVMDLQNHKFSRIIRKLLWTKAWVEFDRTSPISAGERTRQTIEALWDWKIPLDTAFKFKYKTDIAHLLNSHGYRSGNELVVLNPAGYCASRNWPLQSYVAFAKLWLKEKPNTQFVLLLLQTHHKKSVYIQSELADRCINLTGHANQTEAFEVIHMSKFMLTEDSGLMHMAWVQGIPTLALFSSSRKDWSAPQGSWSYCLDSSDLECGPCGLATCKYDDNRCLTRYSPDFVFNIAMQLTKSSI